MKLVCDSCGTCYRLDDELVRGRVVRLRCRHCTKILEARLPRAPPTGARRAPPPLPEREWFLALEDRWLGEIGTRELRARIRRREVGPDDLVWREGFEGWRTVAAVEELRGALDERPDVSISAPPPLSGDRSPVHPTFTPGSHPPGALRSPTTPAGGASSAMLQTAPPSPPSSSSRIAILTTSAKRWPLWVAIFGGMMMVSALFLLLFLRLDRRRITVEDDRALPHEHQAPSADPLTDRAESQEEPRTSVETKASSIEELPDPLAELPAFEVSRPRGARGGGARRDAASDGQPSELHALAETLGTSPGDVPTVLATRVFRQNRGTLYACDRLAERRGETLHRGIRSEFRIRVTADDRAEVEIVHQGLSEGLVACYRAVASRWRFPNAGVAYRTSFVHVQ